MTVFRLLNTALSHAGLTGFRLDIAVALILATGFCSIVILLGRLMDFLEDTLYSAISRLISPKFALFTGNYLLFPGVMLHELAHAIVASATGGKVTKVKFFEVMGHGRLGQVTFIPRGRRWQQLCQMAFSSCAPAVFGMAEVYALYTILTTISLMPAARCLIIYLMTAIICHASMSMEDLKHYLHGMFVVFPAVFTVFLAIQYFAVRMFT